MRTNKVLLSILIVSMLYSCGSGNEETKKAETGKDEKAVSKEMPQVQLTGFYATSQHENVSQYAAEHLFDGTDNAWATMSGSGPDEGIMLYFPEGTDIGKMHVDFAKNSAFEDITLLGLYINGQYMFDFSPTNSSFGEFTMPVNSLYLRILETAKDVEKVLVDNEEETELLREYSSGKPVGLAELKFENSEGEELKIIAPKAIKATVKASTTLEPEQAYGAQNLFDSKYSIAWAEGNEQTSGIGEKVDIEFEEDVVVEKVKFWNGFQRSENHFDANARAKTIIINGKDYALKDEQKPQVLTLNSPVKGKDLSIEIKEIYQGAKYKDLVISEIMFHDGKNWFFPKTNVNKKFKSELLAKKDNGSLGIVVDKWFYNEYQNNIGDYTEEKSILLRSDYTFVIYEEGSQDYSDGFVRQKIYDGNWNIVELGEDKSKVKIFGKRRIVNKGTGLYKGINESDQSLIFHDYLTISKNTIKGERFFGELKY